MSKSLVALALVGALASGSAMAATVTSNGSFFSISYDDSYLGLFGAPTIVGNTIVWSPTGFSTQSLGHGIKSKNSTFAVQVSSKPGYEISGFSLTESGSYAYHGNGKVGVSVTGTLRATSLDPLMPTLVSSILASDSFIANAGGDNSARQWSANATVEGETTFESANVTIENLLVAYSPRNASNVASYLSKTGVTLNVNVAPVPEAETYAMFLAGLGVLGVMMRRRQRANGHSA